MNPSGTPALRAKVAADAARHPRARDASGRCWFVLAAALLTGVAPFPGRAAAALDELTGPWQLFVDDYPVAGKTNVVRVYHPFEKYGGNPVLVTDKPWEGPVYLYGTVLPTEDRTGYRMWYHTLRPNDTNNDGSLELYATSPDGIHWTKPILGLRSWHGSTSNNMYFTRPTAGGMTSVMHTPWETDPGLRYKFMNKDDIGYYAGWSPDGIHVTDAPNNPVFNGGSDVGHFLWDPHTRQYLGYVKNAWYDANGLKRRAVALTATTNITHWPAEKLIFWPDTFDDRWAPAGTLQRTHFYGFAVFPYESMYLSFLWIFRATDAEGYYVGPTFVELASSHDGMHWTRQEGDRPPILPQGPPGAWDDGQVYTARAPVLEGDTLKLWYGGFNDLHGVALTKMTGGIGLATLRKDGFASLDAGSNVGTILTRVLSGASGQLRVNYRAAGGWLKVEVLDEDGQGLPGYGHADCVALTGDSVSQPVVWGSHSELPAGQPRLRLRFLLQNASVYSFMAGMSVTVQQPPTITRQPASRTVAPGESATFTLAAFGTEPLYYQWQKNQLNLSDGGHYAGCATPTLTITGADTNDAAVYRCVVTNASGSVTSNPAALVVGKNSFGSVTLRLAPLMPGDEANEIRALTPDANWAVGISGARGFLYSVNSNVLVNVRSADGAQAALLTGIGYRTHNGQQEVILSGLSSGWYSDFMTTDGTAFASVRRDTGLGTAPIRVPSANGLAGTASDVFYSAWWDSNSNIQERVGRFQGAWPAAPTYDVKGISKNIGAGINGISSTGRAVGWRQLVTNGVRHNYVLDWNGTGTPASLLFNGLDGTTVGEATCVSADGLTVFGVSPVADSATAWQAYKVKSPGASQTARRLPNFPDASGASRLAVPFGCTADGHYAVGTSFRSVEKAVIWDTTSTDPNKWTITDLTDLAAANGILEGFLRLFRAYTVATNADGALVVAGAGMDTNSPPNTRAFLMTIASPLRPLAFPPAAAISGSQATGYTLSFLSPANGSIHYYLEYRTNLDPESSWATIASTPGTGALTALSDPHPADDCRFYRIRIE